MLQKPEPELSPSAVCRSVFRHRLLVSIVFISVLAIFVARVALTPAEYLSEGKLLVRLGRENVALDPTATMGQEPQVVHANRETEIHSIAEILSSRLLREQVVAELGAAFVLGDEKIAIAGAPVRRISPNAQSENSSTGQGMDPQSVQREKAIALLEDKFAVSLADESNVLTLSYQASRPELAQAVLTAYVNAYLGRHQEIHRSPDAHRFLLQQAEQVGKELAATEEQLRELQNRTGLAAIEQQQTILVARIGRLQDKLLDSRTALQAAEAEQQEMKTRLAALPMLELDSEVSGMADPAADAMRKEVFNLQLAEQAMLDLYRPDSSEALRLRRQIGEAKQILADESQQRGHQTASRGRAFQEVQIALINKQTELESLSASEKVLQLQLSEARAELETLSDNSLRMTQLQREIDLQDAQYRLLAGNLQQAESERLLESQRISNLSIVQAPTFQPKPINNHRSLLLLFGLLSACIAGVVVGVTADKWTGTLNSGEDIYRELGLSTLAVLPQTNSPRGSVHVDAGPVPR